AVALRRTHLPAIDRLTDARRTFTDGVEALFHPNCEFTLLSFRQFALVPRLAGSDADRRNLRPDFLVLRILRTELQQEGKILRELQLEWLVTVESRPVDGRSRGRSRLLQVS